MTEQIIHAWIHVVLSILALMGALISAFALSLVVVLSDASFRRFVFQAVLCLLALIACGWLFSYFAFQ